MLIKDVFSVFKQGRSLRNPEVWRSKVALTNTLTGVFTAIAGIASSMGWIHVNIDADSVSAIALGIATFYTVANSLFHVASSKTAGLPAEQPKPSFPELHTDVRPNADAVSLEPITPQPPKPDDTFFG